MRNNVIHPGNVGQVVRCLHCQRDVGWDGETPIRAAPTSSAPPKKIRWRDVGVGAFCLLLALPLLGWGCWQALQAHRSTFWPATEGVVISSTIGHPDNDARSRGRTSSAAQIRYTYQVDGVAYQNDTVRFGNVYTSGAFGIATATVRRHPPGPATIYYDARDPGTSVLEPGLHSLLLVKIVAGLLFTLLGCHFVRKGIRR
jgi:hypothetical protein